MIELIHFRKMKEYNDSYEKLRENKNEWKEELEERQILEGTLMDGLDESRFLSFFL